MNRKENRKLCEDARRIQDILEKGNYTLREWPNSEGKLQSLSSPRNCLCVGVL